MGECHCSKIAIMQLFHELKQQFPALPDHVVSQCIVQNSHDRESCARSLRAAQESRPPPGAFPPPAPDQLLQPSGPPELSQLAGSMSTDEERQAAQEYSGLRFPGLRAHRPVSLDIGNGRSSAAARSAQQQSLALHPSSAPAATASSAFFEELADKAPRQTNSSFELNVNLACSPAANRDFATANSKYELVPSAQQQQQQAAAITPTTSEPSTRSFTSVSLTLRPPASDPQPPIDINSQGSSLTYTSSSSDPRGFQSRLQISIGHGGAGGATAARIKPPVPQRPQSLVTFVHNHGSGPSRPPGLPMGPPSQLPRPTTTWSAPTTPSSPMQSVASPSSSLPSTPSAPTKGLAVPVSQLPATRNFPLADQAQSRPTWIGTAMPPLSPLKLDLPEGPPDDPTALLLFDSSAADEMSEKPEPLIDLPSEPQLPFMSMLVTDGPPESSAGPSLGPRIVPSASRGAIPRTPRAAPSRARETKREKEEDSHVEGTSRATDSLDRGTTEGNVEEVFPMELFEAMAIPFDPAVSANHPKPDELSEEFRAVLGQVEDEIKPLITEQLIRKDRMAKAVEAEKASYEALKKEVDSLSDVSVTSKEYERQLRSEIYQLQLECDRLAAEFDQYSSDPRVPLGETNVEFYKDIYTGQQYPPTSSAVVPPPLPSQPPAWEREPSRIQDPDEDADGPAWVCQWCTFDNHPLLNKCEECDMPRLVESAQGRVSNANRQLLTNSPNFPSTSR